MYLTDGTCVFSASASLDEGSSGASVLSGQVTALLLKTTVCDISYSLVHQ